MSTAPTHGHHTDYAEPVLRAPSPASSVGTSYGADQTSYSDSEFQLSQPAFERKCYELIGLSLPRKEELRADRDPLLTVPGPNGRPMRLSEKKLEPAEEKRACATANTPTRPIDIIVLKCTSATRTHPGIPARRSGTAPGERAVRADTVARVEGRPRRAARHQRH